MVQTAESQLHVRELTNRNDGKEVEAYLKVSGNRKGEPWCGAFMAWVHKQCGQRFPAGAGGARNWFNSALHNVYVRGKKGRTEAIQPGFVVGFYYQWLGRIGHIGLVKERTRNGFKTIEGNTDGGGSREGGGVRLLSRSAGSIYASANWLR